MHALSSTRCSLTLTCTVTDTTRTVAHTFTDIRALNVALTVGWWRTLALAHALSVNRLAETFASLTTHHVTRAVFWWGTVTVALAPSV